MSIITAKNTFFKQMGGLKKQVSPDFYTFLSGYLHLDSKNSIFSAEGRFDHYEPWCRKYWEKVALP
jgi:hypothetical protein